MPPYSQYDEKSLQSAILDVQNGMSVQRASKTWGVPRSTLQNRLKGSESHKIAHSHLQRLSTEQEEKVVQWITLQESLGLAPSHSQIRSFVTKILLLGGDSEPLGRRWMQSFLKRHPELRIKKKETIEIDPPQDDSEEI